LLSEKIALYGWYTTPNLALEAPGLREYFTIANSVPDAQKSSPDGRGAPR
jgi:hypothetical protein